MIKNLSNHNDFSHSPFHNDDGIRPHSNHGSSKISSHRGHHKNPNNSHKSGPLRLKDPFIQDSPNFPKNGPNIKPPHGILHSRTFISDEPHAFPGPSHFMAHGRPVEPPIFISPNSSFGPHFMPPFRPVELPNFFPQNAGLGPHFMPSGPFMSPMPHMGPNIFSPSPNFIPHGQRINGPFPPPPINPPF